MRKLNSTGKTALSGIAAALSVTALMLCGYTYPRLQFILPLCAGMVIYTLSLIVGKRYALGAYIASSMLAMILCAFKAPVFYYVLFFGYYPLLKDFITEKLPGRTAAFICRIVLFNCIGAFAVFIVGAVLSVNILEIQIFGWKFPVVLAAVALNVEFVIYDLMIFLYRNKLTDLQIGNKL